MQSLPKKTVRQKTIHSLQDIHPHPVLNRILVARGVSDARQYQAQLENLLRPDSLSNIDIAVNLLIDALNNQQKILIIGDYDVDGATSTALLTRALKDFGFACVDYITPNRFRLGYGFSTELLQSISPQQADLLITVDNGISSIKAVAQAKEQCFKVIVTDHHLPGEALPDADAIVNPNLPGDAFPSKNLAGVGVVFYLLLHLRKKLNEQKLLKKKVNLAKYLDLVALGTIADVVPLDSNNRLLVKHGLNRIRAGHCIVGIKALCQVAKRSIENLTSSDLAFALAPRLNAAGRLEDMEIGIECLLSDDEQQAQDYAGQLDQINVQRREIETSMKEQAEAQLDAIESALSNPEQLFAITLYHKKWHEGVIGILAARIKEKTWRPVIVFTQTEQGDYLKGSARSIPGIHIRDILEQIDTKNPGLLLKYGGHAMAAGLSIKQENASRFSLLFDNEVKKNCQGVPPEPIIEYDAVLEEADMTLDFASQLQQLGPWGQAFPEPLFLGEFVIVQKRILGQKHTKMTLQYGQSCFVDAICFNQVFPHYVGDKLEIIYKLDINYYQGQSNLQLLVEYLL